MSDAQLASATNPPSYGRVATWLHWLLGVALIGQIAFGFLLDTIAPRGTPARAPTINLHKSIGIVLGLLIVFRLGWRLTHGVPPWPASFSPAQQRAAELGHRALYACMLLMPLSGYAASNFSKYGVRFFGLTWPAWGPESGPVYAFLNGVHVGTAFVFTALIAGHVAMAWRHASAEGHAARGRMGRFA